ncbi:MAG: hypothetical protein ABW189_06785 [Rickettsiales bacterium]
MKATHPSTEDVMHPIWGPELFPLCDHADLACAHGWTFTLRMNRGTFIMLGRGLRKNHSPQESFDNLRNFASTYAAVGKTTNDRVTAVMQGWNESAVLSRSTGNAIASIPLMLGAARFISHTLDPQGTAKRQQAREEIIPKDVLSLSSIPFGLFFNVKNRDNVRFHWNPFSGILAENEGHDSDGDEMIMALD